MFGLLNSFCGLSRGASLSLLLLLPALVSSASTQTPAVVRTQDGGLSLAQGYRLSAVDPLALTLRMQESIGRVQEFRYIQELAAELGVRVYLFGGAASTYAYYAKLDLLRAQLDPSFVENRLDYGFQHIFQGTQDVDLLVDGPQSKIGALNARLQSRFPYRSGSRSKWEVRSLREDMDGKGRILGNPDYYQQHMDSQSSALFELSQTETPVMDLREAQPIASMGIQTQWVLDQANYRLTYFESEQHDQTSRAREGLNPQLISVVRALIKASQFGLEIKGGDLARFKEVVKNSQNTLVNPYVTNWFDSNLPKLFNHAMDIEFATSLVREVGLHQVRGLWSEASMVSLNREPLWSQQPASGHGRIALHVTRDHLILESMKLNPYGRPNVFISRPNAIGETASQGAGFYTYLGRIPLPPSSQSPDLTLNLSVDQRSSNLAQFDDVGLWRNRDALRVIHVRTRQLQPVVSVRDVLEIVLGRNHTRLPPYEIQQILANASLKDWTLEEKDQAAEVLMIVLREGHIFKEISTTIITGRYVGWDSPFSRYLIEVIRSFKFGDHHEMQQALGEFVIAHSRGEIDRFFLLPIREWIVLVNPTQAVFEKLVNRVSLTDLGTFWIASVIDCEGVFEKILPRIANIDELRLVLNNWPTFSEANRAQAIAHFLARDSESLFRFLARGTQESFFSLLNLGQQEQEIIKARIQEFDLPAIPESFAFFEQLMRQPQILNRVIDGADSGNALDPFLIRWKDAQGLEAWITEYLQGLSQDSRPFLTRKKRFDFIVQLKKVIGAPWTPEQSQLLISTEAGADYYLCHVVEGVLPFTSALISAAMKSMGISTSHGADPFWIISSRISGIAFKLNSSGSLQRDELLSILQAGAREGYQRMGRSGFESEVASLAKEGQPSRLEFLRSETADRVMNLLPRRMKFSRACVKLLIGGL